MSVAVKEQNQGMKMLSSFSLMLAARIHQVVVRMGCGHARSLVSPPSPSKERLDLLQETEKV